ALGGVAAGELVGALREGGAAAGRVHVHAEGRVLGEHRLLTRRQHVGVLLVVGRGDRVQRLVGRVRVDVEGADAIAGRRAGDAALPGRDGAGGVAALLGTDRGQLAAELGGLFSTDRGLGHAGGQHGGARDGRQGELLL